LARTKRLLVILDLDETLVHVPDQPLGRRADFTVAEHVGYCRPHLEGFLSELRERYRVAIWTAAGHDYAQAVVSAIVPWHVELAFLWSAEHCTAHLDRETREASTFKKLGKVEELGFDLARVLMVDDSPEKHLRNYANLVPIAPFLGSHADVELPAVAAYLRSLADHPDVRTVEKRFWRTARSVP
jgi:RNA polymerase II subunit A small phosphatase-like protein